jgi:hypothetical protein
MKAVGCGLWAVARGGLLAAVAIGLTACGNI